jgi:hypothetical protein
MRRNLAGHEPDRAVALRLRVDDYFGSSPERDAAPIAIPEEIRVRLRALGYLSD